MKRCIFMVFLAGLVAVAAFLLDAASAFITPLWRSTLVQDTAPPDSPYFHDGTCTLSSGEKARYVLYVPPDYDPAQPCPLIVFLHGVGKRGTDGRKQLKDGLATAICYWSDWRNHSHFLVLFPQARFGTWPPRSADDELVMSELADVQAHYAVDPARIYLTGISSGGTGTWNLAVAHPDLWAAIVPVGGIGNPEDASRLRHLPCWCFHGGEDKTPPPENPQEMMRRLRAEGATPRYTEFPGLGHSVWDKVYRSAELYQWLRQQKRN